jgi:hypothetical protein
MALRDSGRFREGKRCQEPISGAEMKESRFLVPDAFVASNTVVVSSGPFVPLNLGSIAVKHQD